MNKVFVFCEGPTDQVIYSAVREGLSRVQVPAEKPISVGGKTNFRPKILETVAPELTAGEPGSYIGVLVFRDQDAGEELLAIQDAFAWIARELLRQWKLQPEPAQVQPWPNLFRLDEPPTPERPGLRLVLHIAAPQFENLSLRNLTTDGYVLALALQDEVLKRFAGESKVRSSSGILRELITHGVPGTISNCNIAFDEDKDYLAAYLCATRFWTVKRTEEKERLLRLILDRALKYTPAAFWCVLNSWKAAIEEVMQ